MSKIVEEMINEEVREIAMRMLDNGKLSVEEIAMYVGIPVEEVTMIAEEIGCDYI